MSIKRNTSTVSDDQFKDSKGKKQKCDEKEKAVVLVPDPLAEKIQLKPFSPEDDFKLMELLLLAGMGTVKMDWDEIASQIGNGMSKEDCRSRWYKLQTVQDKTKLWTPANDAKLEALVKQMTAAGHVDWEKISQEFAGNWSSKQCLLRWNSIVADAGRTDAKCGPWSPEEDYLLAEAVGIFEGKGRGGSIDWNAVSKYMGGRRSSQLCRNRWMGILVPRMAGGVNSGPWSLEEDMLLVEAVSMFSGEGKHCTIDWTKVAKHMGGKRTSKQCNQRWNGTLVLRVDSGIQSGPWSEEEDALLTEAVRLFDGKGRNGSADWGKVAEYMGGKRSYHQCNHRWNVILKPRRTGNVMSGPWSQDEDKKLMEAVQRYEGQGKGGSVDWNKVSIHMGGSRSSQQCRDKWNYVLKPRLTGGGITSTNWSKDEDAKLTTAVSLYAGHGSSGINWTKVAEFMGDKKTYLQCKKRWNAKVARIEEGSGDSDSGNGDNSSERSEPSGNTYVPELPPVSNESLGPGLAGVNYTFNGMMPDQSKMYYPTSDLSDKGPAGKYNMFHAEYYSPYYHVSREIFPHSHYYNYMEYHH